MIIGCISRRAIDSAISIAKSAADVWREGVALRILMIGTCRKIELIAVNDFNTNSGKDVPLN
jgi:hypothetical protein